MDGAVVEPDRDTTGGVATPFALEPKQDTPPDAFFAHTVVHSFEDTIGEKRPQEELYVAPPFVIMVPEAVRRNWFVPWLPAEVSWYVAPVENPLHPVHPEPSAFWHDI